MISKILPTFFFTFLLSGNCWAGFENPCKYSEKVKLKLEKLAPNSLWIFVPSANRFIKKEIDSIASHEIATPEEVIIHCARDGSLADLSLVLLTKSVSPDYTDTQGNFPLKLLLDRFDYASFEVGECVCALLACGADKNRCYSPGVPLIFKAVQLHAYNIIHPLLYLHADVTGSDAGGQSIVWRARVENLEANGFESQFQEYHEQCLLELLHNHFIKLAQKDESCDCKRLAILLCEVRNLERFGLVRRGIYS
ncbi:hypothetical protein IPF37_05150 [bacterium]|nr:MAG: hypothetical protein IPF37_05150 [bacterium]